MPDFTFDAKAFLTLHITAPDEAAARAFAERLIEHVEGVEARDGDLVGRINSASQDGDADLMEIDGEA